jgi:proteasome accessory factor B
VPGHRAALAAGLKIEAALPPDIRRHCGELLAGVAVRLWPMSDLEAAHDILAQLQLALLERRKVAVCYESYFERGEIDTLLHLYRLQFVNRGWYAIAFSQMHDEVRTFKVERIVRADTLDETYTPDPDFDLEAYYGNAWQMIRGEKSYHVVIHFSPKVAGNVEEIAWHKTQQTERRSDGSLVFEVDVDGVSEIAWWILGYGKEAVVLEPPELREVIVEHARTLTASYASDAPPNWKRNS